MGERASAASSVSRTSATVCEGRPNIRSRLIVKSRLTGNFYGSDHLLPIMDTAEERKRLACLACAAMDSRLTPALRERLRKGRRECSRVAFAGDFGGLFHGECFEQRVQDACCLGLVQQRGMPPPRKIVSACGCPVSCLAVLFPG